MLSFYSKLNKTLIPTKLSLTVDKLRREDDHFQVLTNSI